AGRRAAVIVPPGPRLVDRIEVEPQHWALVEALLGCVLLATDLDEALKLWRGADHAVTVVTPRGEAIDPLGAVTGGSEPPLEETLLARARELRELEGAHAASRERLAAEERVLAERRARAAEAARAAAAVRAAAASERLRAVQADVSHAAATAADMSERLATAERRVTEATAGATAAERDAAAAAEARARAAARGATLGAERERLLAAIA